MLNSFCSTLEEAMVYVEQRVVHYGGTFVSCLLLYLYRDRQRKVLLAIPQAAPSTCLKISKKKVDYANTLKLFSSRCSSFERVHLLSTLGTRIYYNIFY